jgi:hypothetical protein
VVVNVPPRGPSTLVCWGRVNALRWDAFFPVSGAGESGKSTIFKQMKVSSTMSCGS